MPANQGKICGKLAEACHPRGALYQPSGPAMSEDGGGVILLGRTYLVMYTDGRKHSQTERGSLVALDQDGFVVLEVNGKYLLIPKGRVDALVGVE